MERLYTLYSHRERASHNVQTVTHDQQQQKSVGLWIIISKISLEQVH